MLVVANPVSLSDAVTVTCMLLLFTVPTFILTFGFVVSFTLLLAYSPTFTPSVNLAYMFVLCAIPVIVPPLVIFVHVPVVDPF